MKKLFLVTLAIISAYSFAYTDLDVSNAQYLADQKLITKQSSEAKFRLDDTITRAEVVGMALKIQGKTLPENYTCKNYFSDVKYDAKNNWICRAVELAADAELVSRSNAKFRPQDNISRAEALAILTPDATTENLSYTTNEGNQWQKETLYKYLYYTETYVKFYTQSPLEDGTKIYPDYSNFTNGGVAYIQWSPDKAATRAEVFGFARNIISKSTNSDQEYEAFTADFDGQNVHRSTYEQNIIYAFGEGGEFEGSYAQEFSIFIEPIDSVLYFDSGEKIEKKDWAGYTYYASMSGGMCYSGKLVFIGENNIITASGTCGQTIQEVENALKKISFKLKNYTREMTGSDVLNAYYDLLNNNGNVDQAFDMRSPSGVARATFQSWYKNVTAVKFRKDTLKDLGDSTYEFFVDMTENNVKSTFKVKSKVDLENFTIDNISSVKQ